MGSRAKRKLEGRRQRKVKRGKADREHRENFNGNNLCSESADLRPYRCGILDLPDLAMQLVFSILGVERLRAAQGVRARAISVLLTLLLLLPLTLMTFHDLHNPKALLLFLATCVLESRSAVAFHKLRRRLDQKVKTGSVMTLCTNVLVLSGTVCRRWAKIADSPEFKVSVKPDTGLVSAIEACPAGGIVEIAQGYYQV